MTAIVKYKDPATGKWLKLNSEFTPEICAAVSTTDVPSLVGYLVIDGYQTKADDFVLLAKQAIPDYNGVWKVSDIGWVRSTEQPGVSGLVYVGAGATYARTYWLCTKTSPNSVFVPLSVAIGVGGGGTLVRTLDDLEDVNVSLATDGQVLTYSQGWWLAVNPIGSNIQNLDDLSDVHVTGAINDQVLSYKDGTWISRTIADTAGAPPHVPSDLPPGYIPQVGDLRLDPATSWLQYYYADSWINASHAVAFPDLDLIDPSVQGGMRKGMLVYDGKTDAYYLYWPQDGVTPAAADYAVLQKVSYKAVMDPANPSVGIPVSADNLEQVYNNPDPGAPRITEFRNMVVINHDWNTRDYLIQVSDGESGTTIEARIERSPNVVQVSINASANYPNTITVLLMKLL